ncbi:MAG: hypothetical protein ABJA98_32195 [Acidobacteriota bacterium]
MKRSVVTLMLSLMSAPLGAQWLNHPTPGMPRTTDGTPHLTAPAPRMSDGTPDLSGIWRLNGLGYTFNIFGNHPVDMLPWAKAVYTERVASYGKGSPDTNCLPAGPRAGLFGQDPVKFVQTPGLLLVLYEDAPTRQIFLDGRALPKDPNPSWMGYSVGHWEGDTLVVDTAGFNDRTWLDLAGHPHTESLHVTERFRRVDFGRIQLQMTFDDPNAYAKSWTIPVEVTLVPDTELLENVCHENEKDRTHLVGSLQDEQHNEATVSRAILSRYIGAYGGGPARHRASHGRWRSTRDRVVRWRRTASCDCKVRSRFLSCGAGRLAQVRERRQGRSHTASHHLRGGRRACPAGNSSAPRGFGQ